MHGEIPLNILHCNIYYFWNVAEQKRTSYKERRKTHNVLVHTYVLIR